MKLIQETKFLDNRQRGAGTLPVQISKQFNYQIEYFTKELMRKTSEPFVWFYRDITSLLKLSRIYFLYKFRGNGTLYYSRSLQELDLSEEMLSKYLIIKDQIVGNGFYYCKYYQQRYLPTYFSTNYRYTEDIPKKYKYGIYIRDEYPDDELELKKFLQETGTNPREVLIFGKSGMFSERNCTFKQEFFFNNIENYLVVSARNDAVPNTLVEVLHNKIPVTLLNQLQPASGTKEILEGFNHYGYEKFFKLLDKLNSICWKQDPNDNIDKINKYFNKSKTFIDFLSYIEKDDYE